MKIHSCLVIILVFVFTLKVNGQSSKNLVNEQIWLDFNPDVNINPALNVYGRLDVRTIFPQNWYRFIAGGGVAFKRHPYVAKKAEEEFHAGLGLFYTLNTNVADRFEIRPYQGYKLKWPTTPKLMIQNYVRLEERFEFTGNGGDENFGLRLRYMIQATLQCKDCKHSSWKPFYFPLNAEFFISLNNTTQFNDVMRIGPGIGYRFASGWRPEFDLSFHRTRGASQEEFTTSDVVFRCRLFYKFPDRQDKSQPLPQ